MEAPWWQSALFYEIYMPSFCDGNGDGIGDFAGIASKLDELAKLGVNGLWLTPFYLSPKVDNGYDIADYTAIDPDYGTMEDFEAFIREAHARDIRVIVDLVLNHTSSEHRWFRNPGRRVRIEARLVHLEGPGERRPAEQLGVLLWRSGLGVR